jgi:subtilisin family serine protease
MKLFWMLGLLLSSVVSTQLYATDLDSTLEGWLKEKSFAGFADETRDVIVYFGDAETKDRSGMFRSFAIEQERLDQIDQLNDKGLDMQLVMSSNSFIVERFWSANAMLVRVDKATLRELKKIKSIDAISHDEIIMLDEPKKGSDLEPGSDLTYGLNLIKAREAWDKGFEGQGVVVGVLDSGIDLEHPALEGLTILSKDFTNDNTVDDKNGHGTHVAGTIAGNDHNGTHIGVAPKAKLIIGKIFDKRGSSKSSVILRAMEWMLDPDGDPNTDDAPRVVSNSWGTSSMFALGFKDIVRQWRRFEIFPSFAAGNSGPTWMSMGAPGRYPFAFSVGAVDAKRKIAGFSSRGPSFWLDRWGTAEDPDRNYSWWQGWWPKLTQKPEISAPGVNVYSAQPGGTYQRLSGTSMATPHLTGVIALMLSANPDLSVAQIESMLTSSVQDLGKPGADSAYGAGMILADVAVEKAMSAQGLRSQFFNDQGLAR